MPIFATPNRFWYYFFSDMRRLDRLQRILIAFFLWMGLLTLTLRFIGFESTGSGQVRWTGFDVLSSILRGSPSKPVPPMPSWAGTGMFGVWDPLYVIGVVTGYASLAVCAFAIVFQPLRRLIRLAGPVGAFAAYTCLGRSNLYAFDYYIHGVHAGVGPLMLAIILIVIWLIADVNVVPD